MTSPADSAAAAGDRSSILIVDDMEENLVAFEAVLGPLEQHLVRARSGEEALKAMLREEFAVVLIDVLMPGLDGFETTANIKCLDQTKNVPVILVTGNDPDTDYAYRGYAVGAADFLSKPIDPWILRTKVNVFLELHRKNRQLAEQAEQLRRLLVSERETTGNEERLTEVLDRLARTEQAVRDLASASGDRALLGRLADRMAALEHAVGELTAASGTDAAARRTPPKPSGGAERPEQREQLDQQREQLDRDR